MNGSYGTKKPAFLTTADYDIFYNYRPTRGTDSTNSSVFTKLNSNLLQMAQRTTDDNNITTLPGIYDMRLPLDVFGKSGIYTLYITPKEVIGEIVDVAPLNQYPDVIGIVINANKFTELNGEALTNNGLVGYRVEYYDTEDESIKSNIYRIITSSNRCEPVQQNNGESSTAYQPSSVSNLIFCTLTPSTNMSYYNSAASKPYIGSVGQKISVTNTKFDPISLEIEMTEHDIETVTTMLEGNQIRNLDNGLITTFNNNGEIYHQASYGTVTNINQGINHDVKLKNDALVNVEEGQKYEEIIDVI